MLSETFPSGTKCWTNKPAKPTSQRSHLWSLFINLNIDKKQSQLSHLSMEAQNNYECMEKCPNPPRLKLQAGGCSKAQTHISEHEEIKSVSLHGAEFQSGIVVAML